MSFSGGQPRRGDASGPPTYRHLLSPQAMTVFNPLRVIAHCDIDAAYAQFEQVRLGLPDTIPLICAQWQSIIAVNYPARKYGIKRFNTIDEAKKMCPHLHVQHVATYRNGESEAGYWGEVDPRTHKVSLDPYRRESLKILAIFKDMAPGAELEKASIDEAFLDLSPLVIQKILALFPHLSSVPEDAPDGLDSSLPPPTPIDWTKAGSVFPINGETDQPQVNSQPDSGEAEEAGPEQEEQSGQVDKATWEDWALCLGAEIMAELREEVWKKLHYTCSAGIAHNKAMAKLCSAWKKPNNQTVLRSAATAAFLRDMAFTDIRFLGGKLGNAIATEYNAKTVGDMLTVPLDEMQARFGEESIWVYNILRGVDHTEVTPRVATKSMLASKNVRPSVTTPEQGHHWLGVLAGELNVRLRDAREISPGLWPKSLVLSHRTGIEPSRSRQIPFPFTRTLTAEYILKYARKLWDEATQPMSKGNMKLNNIALAFSGLEKLEEGQRGIEGFFGSSAAKPDKSLKRSASGSSTNLTPEGTTPVEARPSPTSGPSPKKPRLPTLHTNKRKTGLDAFLVKNGESSKSIVPQSQPSAVVTTDQDKPKTDSAVPADDDDDIVLVETAQRWTCPRCKTTFKIPEDVPPEDRAGNLKHQQAEHEDFHFAMDLQNGPSPVRLSNTSGPGPGGGKSGTSTAVGAGKVKKKKPEGIKAFFAPKGK